jgi:hypothetical protein
VPQKTLRKEARRENILEKNLNGMKSAYIVASKGHSSGIAFGALTGAVHH